MLTLMSYGYEPQKQSTEGSWSEVWALTRAVFVALAVPLGLIALALGLVLGAIVALFSNPPLALLPLSILGAGWYYMVQKDKRAQADLDEEINGTRPMRDRRNDRRPPG